MAWPLWMSAPVRCLILSLSTWKCLIKLKWFKNNDDKYLKRAVLHSLMALSRFTTLRLVKIWSGFPVPRCLRCLWSALRCVSYKRGFLNLMFKEEKDWKWKLANLDLEDKEGLVRHPIIGQPQQIHSPSIDTWCNFIPWHIDDSSRFNIPKQHPLTD